MPTEQQIRDALKQVKFPGFSRDIVSFGLVKEVVIENGSVGVAIAVQTRDPAVADQIKSDAETVLGKLSGVNRAVVNMRLMPPPSAPTGAGVPTAMRVAGIKKSVAVASCKGGVGKSTIATNLACALQKLGGNVGLMDCDIYGPSVVKMLGITDRPTMDEQEHIVPVEQFGIKLISMAMLVGEDDPLIWRGPMLMKAIRDFAHNVRWGELDELVVDLPPGTGDAPLSLVQTIELDGVVIVTTPQDVALGIVKRGIKMFEKVNVPILGIIENMTSFECPHCHKTTEIFSHGGGHREADRLGIPFLGEVPLLPEIRIAGDKGLPLVVAAPDSAPAKIFLEIARRVKEQLG